MVPYTGRAGRERRRAHRRRGQEVLAARDLGDDPRQAEAGGRGLPRREGGARGDHRAGLLQRRPAAGHQGRRPHRRPDRRAAGQRADRGGARLRPRQEEGPDDRRLRLRRRHLRHLDPRGRRGGGRGQGDQRRHPPGRRQHRPADHRVAARGVQEGPGDQPRQRSDGDPAPEGGGREGEDRALLGAGDRHQPAVHHRGRLGSEAPEHPARPGRSSSSWSTTWSSARSPPAGRRSRTPGVEAKEIDEVVLVGGQTRMPAIQKVVKDFFGKEPHKGRQPGRGGGDRRGDPGRRPGAATSRTCCCST